MVMSHTLACCFDLQITNQVFHTAATTDSQTHLPNRPPLMLRAGLVTCCSLAAAPEHAHKHVVAKKRPALNDTEHAV